MGKSLSEMSLTELWELFPIVLTEHRPEWLSWYEGERQLIETAAPEGRIIRLSHIGSTAVDGIWAKPIIDILAETGGEAGLADIKAALLKAGYGCMSESPVRLSFQKGYTENGFAERVFHLHLRLSGDHDELYFRDYLNAHPEAAKEYEALKLGLWKRFEHDRDGYTDSKTDFVQKYTQRAKREFGPRYESGARRRKSEKEARNEKG